MEHPQVLRYLWRRLFVNWLCRSRWASLVAQLVKNPPAVQETWVGFLGWEDPLEKAMGYPLQCSGLDRKVSDTADRLSLSLFTWV